MGLQEDLNKKFGEGLVYKMGDAPILDIEVTPTGSLALDIALGAGGIPRGRVVEIFGPESSGKSTVCQHMVAEAQKLGIECAFIDMEHAVDPRYMAACGVDVESLWISQPDHGEQALDLAEALAKSGQVGLIIIDSVAALVPKAELEGSAGEAHVGLQARLMSQAMRKLSGLLKKNKCTLVLTNQLRMKIGVPFGNPETTSGGRAIPFYASVRLDIRRIQTLKDRGDAVANRTRVRVKKNKVGVPYGEAEFDIEYGKGISRESELIDLGEEVGVIEKRGSWYSYGEESIQGKENFKEWLRNHQEVADEIEKTIRVHYGLVQEEKDG